MDNHPIPQDVTGFQFKLIGNMTIKQFAYVAFGVIVAVILYYLPLNSAFGVIIKTVFIPIIGGSGFLIAFLPIEGRPVDVMVGNFIKAIFLPNQFIYHKSGRLLNFTTFSPSTHAVSHPSQAQINSAQETQIKGQRLNQLLANSHTVKPNKLDQRESAFLTSLSSLSPMQAPAHQTLVTTPVQPPQLQEATPTTAPNTAALAQQETALVHMLEEAKKEITSQQVLDVSSAAHQKVTLLERQVQTLHFQREQLEQQLAHLQKQLAAHKEPPQTAAPQAPVQQANNQAPKPAPQGMPKGTGLPHVPDTPNVIVGIVKDPRGNVLPNILVEVKDKDGNPVRAFKTNPLGQFASATPLAAGAYTVELEDPKKQNTFSVIQLNATNQILLPIEIISHDAREELRKQLFN